MKRKLSSARVVAVTAVIAGAAFSLSACGHDNFRDLKGVHNVHPDYIVNVENMDKQPNIGMLCIHGAGIVTTTRNNAADLRRVPEWDSFCRTQEK